MREPAPDYTSRQYERPNQPWVCGLASDGPACPAGPTAGGRCPALAECVPARDGDRWICNRSPLRGGVCGEGPTPEGGCGRVNRCQPGRSLRALRGRFVAACAMLTAGCLLVLLSADWRDLAISPGPLARQHGQLLVERSPARALKGKGNCAICHAAADRGAFGWTASLVVGHGEQAHQSQRCLECHDDRIASDFALAAHSAAPEVLREITRRKSASAAGEPPSLSRRGEPTGSHELACATCHHEHQGAAFDLSAMNDNACQACHARRYGSFATDHPDFGAWPYERRTRIAFNHASHRSKHFAEKQRAFDCRSCHVDDSTGRVQLLASYEAACAACHDESIATSLAQGVPVVALPTLDVAALEAAGHEIGPWPEEATGDFDGALPPAMKLLLAAETAAAQAVDTLGVDFSFFDVDPDSKEQLAASAVLAKAIRELLADWSRRGPMVMRERLAATLGRAVTDAEVRAIAAGLAAEPLRGAARAWFPEQDAGSGAWAMNSAALSGPGPGDAGGSRGEPARWRAFAPAGTWNFDASALRIVYRPASHADPVLAGWLELLASTPDLAEKPLALAMFKEFSKPTAVGRCTSCHSVEQSPGGRLVINWRASDRSREPRGLTTFSHGPHLVLPQLADCTACHVIDESASAADAYADWDPHDAGGEFAPLSKQSCAECHTARAAGDHCQQCHNYHAEAVEWWRVK